MYKRRTDTSAIFYYEASFQPTSEHLDTCSLFYLLPVYKTLFKLHPRTLIITSTVVPVDELQSEDNMNLFTTWIITDILLLSTTFLILIYLYSTRHYSYWKLRGVPHEKPLPIIGNFLRVLLGKVQLGRHLGILYNKFTGPYFGIYVLDKPYLVLRCPELIKKILIKDFNVFYDRNFGADDKADSLASNSLFILKNPDWKKLRIKLTPVFTSGKMKMMLPLMKEVAVDLQNYVAKNVDKTIEMKEICAKYTTDMIASCAFGIKANCFEYENTEFRMAGKRMFTFNFFRGIQLFSYFFAPNLVKIFKFKFIDNVTATFLRSAFSETITKRENSNIKRNDFVDILINIRKQNGLKDHFKFDSERMVSQAITFFTAGYETTSNTIAFTLYELCLHQEIQDRVRKEINCMIEKHGDITYEAIQEMKYLDMVVAETLRKYPFAPFLNREAAEDYLIKETGLVIEKGLSVLIPLDGLHYDEKYFPSPNIFDPERFSEENKRKISQCTYLPFGEGPRNCIGERFGLLSGKVGLVYFLKEFLVESVPETPDPIVFNPKAPFLVSVVGLPMKIRKL